MKPIDAGTALDVEITFTRHYRIRLRAGVPVPDRAALDEAIDGYLSVNAHELGEQIDADELPEVGANGPWLASVKPCEHEPDPPPCLVFDGVTVAACTPFSPPQPNDVVNLWGHGWGMGASVLWRTDGPPPDTAMGWRFRPVNEVEALVIFMDHLKEIERVVVARVGHIRCERTGERAAEVVLADGTRKHLSHEDVSMFDGCEMWTSPRPFGGFFAVREGEIVALVMPLTVKGSFVEYPIARLNS